MLASSGFLLWCVLSGRPGIFRFFKWLGNDSMNLCPNSCIDIGFLKKLFLLFLGMRTPISKRVSGQCRNDDKVCKVANLVLNIIVIWDCDGGRR